MSKPKKGRQASAIARIITNCGSQTALAARINVSQALISKWLNESIPIAPHQVVKLEQEFPGLVRRSDIRPDLWG